MNGYNDDQNQYNQNNNNGYQSDERYRLEQERQIGYQSDERYRLEQERQIQIEDERLRRILAEIDQKSSFECSLNVAAQWNFETNVNEITQVEAVSTFSQNSQYKWFTVAKFISINFTFITSSFTLITSVTKKVTFNMHFLSLNISYVECGAHLIRHLL